MEKEYWFFLESHIYVNFKDKEMLLYDTHSGNKLLVTSSEAIQIIRKIYEDKNLGSIKLTENDVVQTAIHKFMNDVIALGMGQLIDAIQQPLKPVVLLPILSLNLDVEKLKEKGDADLLLERNISKYLLDVNIVLNSSCRQSCVYCDSYYKQFFCCSKKGEYSSLTRNSITDLLCQISYYPVHTINITGGNIYEYEALDLFQTSNESETKVFNFYIHYLNYQENPYVDAQKIHIIVNPPVDMERFKTVHSLVRDKDVKYHLIIENIEQYNELEMLVSEMELKYVEIHPFYNGENGLFFEENVYLTEEDILMRPISMREIFRNQKLNANSFGSLYILPNGDIKANLNEDTIGHLDKDRIIDVINIEMMQNTAWRKVRSSEPCKDCVYQFLCPPLSNYERAINKQNLCHVQK